MAKLPGWLLMIAGAIVLGYSLFIEKRVGSNLIVFIWVGAAVILWGIGREVRTRVRKRPEKERPEPPKVEPERPREHHARTHEHVRPAQHPSHPHEPTHKACPRCHRTNFHHAHFCHNCGFRFH